MSSNIKIAAIEQSQSIQFFNFPAGQGSGSAPDNSLPLVNRKQTMLRVYIDAKQNDNTVPVPATVDGILWAVNPNTGGGGIYKSLKGPVTARDAFTIKRAQPGQTLDFLIPWSVCQDQVLCEIAVFDPSNRGSQNSDVNFVTLTFIEVPALSLHSVLIHYTGVDFFDKPVDAQTTSFDVLFTADYLLRIYPVSDFNFDGCEVLEWNSKLAVTDNFYALKSTIDNMRAMSGTNDVYAGLIPPAAGCGGICGLGGGGAAIFFVGESLQQPGGAHEIGHALGRSHAPGCLPSTDRGDQNYPQYNGFSRASIGECGVDWRGLVLFDPQTTSDYMSYCQPVWTSPYGYNQILTALQSGAFSPASASPLAGDPGAPRGAEYHYVNFRVDARVTAKERVTVVSSFHIPRPRPLSRALPSEVSVELLDDEGALLSGFASETDLHADNNVPFQYFRAYFPHFPELRRIRIVRSDEILAEYEVAREPPALSGVTVAQKENRIHLKWKGSAVDGVTPPLEYGVRFSADGQKWRAVVTATTEDELVLNTELLPGGNECRIQVIASAGFRTTVHETNTFSLPKKARIAYIASPKSGEEFEFGTPVTFSGTAFSPDFGISKPDEIVWTSLAAGTLGVGQQLMTTDLPVGHHWVTIHAPDGAGGLASKSVGVRVVPPKGRCRPTGTAPVPSEQLKKPCGCR
ncbi:Uncharacterised protein [Burkholderia pseudomallei]|uniref:hypothetical protein n=1 Tax=Burkholderia pseudomallei TaxID=28450 RepID=UPI000976B947|nr:hypothetical protein [Burkholderia pseudomallei]MBD2953685.1 hypothetical protein [Burkholderia pseudomallei]MBD2972050.1 hypothetical protein [Burkholderia pseudomallei]MBO2978694.1 hypothetical protein [Burkholderia pseudomallei]MCW0024659.1 hypothetical protein [Burkholderia pseudomallei]MCW0156038.1 hypothetical protein [Burkholderia pseudomallei]